MSSTADEDSLGDLFGRASADAKAYARAEIKLIQARATARVRAVQGAVIVGLLAAVLAFATLVALLIGLILVIAGMPGSGWGTLAVALGGFLLSAILGWLAASGLKRGLKTGDGR